MTKEEQRKRREAIIDAMSLDCVALVQFSLKTAVYHTNLKVCDCGLAKHIDESLEMCLRLLVESDNDKALVEDLRKSFAETYAERLN